MNQEILEIRIRHLRIQMLLNKLLLALKKD